MSGSPNDTNHDDDDDDDDDQHRHVDGCGGKNRNSKKGSHPNELGQNDSTGLKRRSDLPRLSIVDV